MRDLFERVGTRDASDRNADVERLGSTPYASLDIPEPMVFDLVCELDALKFATQWTFGRTGRSIHGTQFIAEYLLHLEFAEHWILQFGAGVLYLDGAGENGIPALVSEGRGWYPQVAFRLIYNF